MCKSLSKSNACRDDLPRVVAILAAIFVSCSTACVAAIFEFDKTDDGFRISTTNYVLRIQSEGFRHSFARPNGPVIAPPHSESGLVFAGSPAAKTQLKLNNETRVVFEVENQEGIPALLEIEPNQHFVRFSLSTSRKGRILARTGGIGPSFGLGDHFGVRRRAAVRTTTEATGYINEGMRAAQDAGIRLVSNFLIAPGAGFAVLNIEPNLKIVRVTDNECAQGVTSSDVMPALYYFIGTTREIYKEFLDARNRHGYRFYRPKYEWFGVGWEAWGALAWETNQKTVTENVDRYLELGYPLSWMVVGSGFWPRHEPEFHATTSFGMWDDNLYPDPRALIEHYRNRGLKFIIGLRIAFITDGPYSAEGASKGYFITENGTPKVFKISFPKSPVYLLDTKNAEAIRWYIDLCQKWLDYGVDGFKEDLYGYGKYIFPDDKIDPVNVALMDRGVYVMGRNGYLGSPMDLHRYDDFNWDQNQDRGPINGLAFAYSGFPYVYPDIIGGTMTIRSLPPLTDPKLKRYFMRYAQYAALHPSMAVGFGPWNFQDPEVDRVMLDSAKLHARLHPMIYSAALDAFDTGFPHTFTPLPLLWPDDPEVYKLENTTRRSYQWLIGDSLLATPLYGDDCGTAETRDVYLPEGKWMDWDTGEIFKGPRTLQSFALPPGKTPLFVGGSGIVVEQDLQTKRLRAFVYPVSERGANMRFTHPDGNSLSRVQNDADFTNSPKLKVRNATTGKTEPFTHTERTRAISFEIQPGHDYVVENTGERQELPR
jgi:alpha-glucosidase (family GH31 glycosyl hydrolase)